MGSLTQICRGIFALDWAHDGWTPSGFDRTVLLFIFSHLVGEVLLKALGMLRSK